MPTRILDRTLGPEDLAMCKRVFDQACRRLALDPSSMENEFVASRILALFKAGFLNEQELLAEVIARKD